MKSKTQLIISIVTLVVMIFGASYAYFTAGIKSNKNVMASSMSFNVDLNVIGEYIGFPIIPTNDDDIQTAYNSQCKDLYDNGACHSYIVSVTNHGSLQVLAATLNVTLNGINNLSYMVLDAGGSVITNITHITDNTNFTLASGFTLDTNESVTYIVIIWLTNLNEAQDEEQSGAYAGSITVSSINGDTLSGSISGQYAIE